MSTRPKTLYLLRHAKSGWDDPVARDFDRPLNKRGEKAARVIGEWMASNGLNFEHVIASPAVRVIETLDGVWAGFGRKIEPTWERRIYLASGATVLDVLRDERVLPRVQVAGDALRQAVRQATDDDDRVGDVRGMGLANAIELVTDRASATPDAAMAAAVKDGLRQRGVLVGSTGPDRNILKVRPPLAFTEREVPVFVDALRATLHSLKF